MFRKHQSSMQLSVKHVKSCNTIVKIVHRIVTLKGEGFWAEKMIVSYIFGHTTPDEREKLLTELRRMLNE